MPNTLTDDSNKLGQVRFSRCPLPNAQTNKTNNAQRRSSRNKKINKYKNAGIRSCCRLLLKGIVSLTTILNSYIRLNHFPTHWKFASIIMIHKPNKPENMVTSYRPIIISYCRSFLTNSRNIEEKYYKPFPAVLLF